MTLAAAQPTAPPTPTFAGVAPMCALEFSAPGPGSWELAASHQARPLSRYLCDLMPEPYMRGFRDAMAAYGALLDTIEIQSVNGFLYTCARPFGAPPDAKGPPPKLVFKLLLWLHPGLRKRVRRAAEIYETRLWREETRTFREQWLPAAKRTNQALQAVEPAQLSTRELIEHLIACRESYRETSYLHHRMVCAHSIPVGDFIAHVCRWTRRPATEVLDLLRGSSTASRGAEAELDRMVAAVRQVPALLTQVRSATNPTEIIESLRTASGEPGQAARAWLEAVGHRIITGFDVADRTAIELPEMLVNTLRTRLAEHQPVGDEDGGARTAAIRELVPREHRDTFDDLLAEARLVYGVRDERNIDADSWAIGLARRALLEAGARLVAAGKLHRADHAVDLTHDEVVGLLGDREAPDRDQVEARVRRREDARIEDAPDRLGAPVSPPPPAEWMPAAAARMSQALAAYISAMFDEATPNDEAATVTGLAASPGRYVGTARVVLTPGDFDKVREGDVLVARMTTPTYNVLLPLLGGVVTDRGGLLSHPAIVTREYGIPGVVGSKHATQRIPDGAKVEIDGDEGTVRLLS